MRNWGLKSNRFLHCSNLSGSGRRFSQWAVTGIVLICGLVSLTAVVPWDSGVTAPAGQCATEAFSTGLSFNSDYRGINSREMTRNPADVVVVKASPPGRGFGSEFRQPPDGETPRDAEDDVIATESTPVQVVWSDCGTNVGEGLLIGFVAKLSSLVDANTIEGDGYNGLDVEVHRTNSDGIADFKRLSDGFLFVMDSRAYALSPMDCISSQRRPGDVATLHVDRTFSISGRLVSSCGRTVDGSELVVHSRDPGCENEIAAYKFLDKLRFRSIVAGDGSFEIVGLPCSAVGLTVRATGAGVRCTEWSIASEAERSGGDLGIVSADCDGVSVTAALHSKNRAAADLQCRLVKLPRTLGIGSIVVSAVSSEFGLVEFNGVRPGSYALDVVNCEVTSVYQIDVGSTDIDLGSIEVRPSRGDAKCTILNNSGRQMSGAEVWLDGGLRLTADEEGKLVIPALSVIEPRELVITHAESNRWEIVSMVRPPMVGRYELLISGREVEFQFCELEGQIAKPVAVTGWVAGFVKFGGQEFCLSSQLSQSEKLTLTLGGIDESSEIAVHGKIFGYHGFSASIDLSRLSLERPPIYIELTKDS